MLRALLLISLWAITAFAADPVTKTDPDLVKDWMMALASDEMEGRKAGTPGAEKAAEWLAVQFRKAGLKPPPGRNTFFQYFKAKTEAAEIPTLNVIGYIPGSDPNIAQPAVLFGAHWDHIGLAAEGEDLVFNGADDNASGVIAFLGVAKRVTEGIRKGTIERPKRSLIFIAWGAEEIGLLGSKHYVQEAPAFPVEDIAVYFNFELVGHSKMLGKRKVWLTGAPYSDFQGYLKPVMEKHKWQWVENPFPKLQLFFRSDNFPFAGVEVNRETKSLVGIPAHSFSTWGGEDHYHQVHDNPESIDFENLASFIDMIADAGLVIANHKQVPQWLENPDYTFTRYQGAE